MDKVVAAGAVANEAVGLADKIYGLVRRIELDIRNGRNIDQAAFVKNLNQTVWYETGQRYNVMVMDLSLPGPPMSPAVTGLIKYTSAEAFYTSFGVWVFKGTGTFTNLGAMGHQSWMGCGHMERFDLEGNKDQWGRVMKFYPM